MKVKASVKKRSTDSIIVVRRNRKGKKRVYVLDKKNPRFNQRQG
ncbi:50S ribosomal protein L36 [Candidatus Dojkabacteria bacterium]|nr:50S ribosomal protein L36 [Candidatus Dojkabacteria bacterium]